MSDNQAQIIILQSQLEQANSRLAQIEQELALNEDKLKDAINDLLVLAKDLRQERINNAILRQAGDYEPTH